MTTTSCSQQPAALVMPPQPTRPARAATGSVREAIGWRLRQVVNDAERTSTCDRSQPWKRWMALLPPFRLQQHRLLRMQDIQVVVGMLDINTAAFHAMQSNQQQQTRQWVSSTTLISNSSSSQQMTTARWLSSSEHGPLHPILPARSLALVFRLSS